MSNNSLVRLTINFNDRELDLEDRDKQAQRLMAELKQMDELESVNRVLDPVPPEGHKSIGGMLIGVLTAEISTENAKRVMSFLGNRLSGKVIELSVEANGKKLTVKAHSKEELQSAIKLAQEFIEV